MSSKSRRIEIKICSPNNPIRIISARLSGKIEALNTLYPDSHLFIFHGIKLDPSKSFFSYGISDGDILVSLPKTGEEDNETTKKWLMITKDSENFHEQVQSLLNQNTTMELARITDLHITRLCQKPRIYSKIISFIQTESTDRPADPIKTELSFTPLSEPATEALPVFW